MKVSSDDVCVAFDKSQLAQEIRLLTSRIKTSKLIQNDGSEWHGLTEVDQFTGGLFQVCISYKNSKIGPEDITITLCAKF